MFKLITVKNKGPTISSMPTYKLKSNEIKNISSDIKSRVGVTQMEIMLFNIVLKIHLEIIVFM